MTTLEIDTGETQVFVRRARTLSVSIAAPVDDAYAFVSNPQNLPQWAHGLGATPTPLPDGAWRVETPGGPMRVTFAPRNPFGVVDHTVTALDGAGPAVDIVLRVVPNGSGSEVLFTLFQQPGMTDAQYDADADAVRDDLERLKRAMER